MRAMAERVNLSDIIRLPLPLLWSSAGKAGVLNDQRVISHDVQWRRYRLQTSPVLVVRDCRNFSMHHATDARMTWPPYASPMA